MKVINTYNDILNEGGLIPSFQDNTDIIEILLQFLKVQDNLFDITVNGNDFILKFKLDGYEYKIKGYIENAKVCVSGINRYKGDDNLEFSYDSDKIEHTIKTRDVYEKVINKIIRLIKPV